MGTEVVGAGREEGLPAGYRSLAAGIIVQALRDAQPKNKDVPALDRWASAVVFLCDPFGSDALLADLGLSENALAAFLKKNPGRMQRGGAFPAGRRRKNVNR